MRKVVRLTEGDLVRIVKRVINEQQQSVLIDVDSIPCIKHNFRFQVYKIVNRDVLSKFGVGSKPVLSKGNYVIIDRSNLSYPDKEYGDATIVSNGQKVGSFSLDKTTLGDEISSIIEKVYVDQGGDKFKIGWVFCNGQLYIYDILGETSKR